MQYEIQVMTAAIMGAGMKNTAGDDGGVESDAQLLGTYPGARYTVPWLELAEPGT